MDYIIVPTSKCLYQEWQLRLLKWSAEKVKQKGKIIFLVSHDQNHSNENPKFNFPGVEIIELPDWAKEWELKNNDWWGGIPNKYESVKWLTENKSFNPNDRLLFLDPDMIFTKSVDLYPKHNEVIGQEWGDFHSIENYPSNLDTSIMYPFSINFYTLKKIVKDYKEYCVNIRKNTNRWESEMWGLHYSLEKNNIKFTPLKDLGRCTVWNQDNSVNTSKIIHFPNKVESKDKENLFFKQDYTFSPEQKIEVNKGRNLTDKILLSNIDQERTDYIYEAKWNFPYLFKHYTGDKGYLFFQPWPGGFNNIRMSFEQAVCLAYLTDRILVLPPAYNMYLNEGENTLSDFFETENLGVKHISFEELCDIKNIEQNLDKLKESSKVLNYDAVANVINFEKVPVPSKFHKERTIINSEDVFDDSEIIYLDKNLLGTFHQTFYTKHETSLKQLIGKYVVYRNDLRDIAWQFINYIEDKSYYSIHVRRNDFQYKDLFISGEELYNNIKNIIPLGSKLYISTDSDDPNLFNTLKQNYQVIFYKDILSQLNIESFSDNWIPLIEQLICTRSIKFIGNENSTLSSYIYKLRCYMNDIEDKAYYLNTIPQSPSTSELFVFEKEYKSNWVREYRDVAFFDKSIIFVSIASYMDTQIFDTLKSLYEEVSNPNKIRVIVHLQDTEEQYQKILELDYPNLEVMFTPNTETKGVVWARNRIKDKYNNEAYFLGIDSHSRFKKNWDLILINQYISIEEPKVILSTYPNHFDVPDLDKEYLNLPYNAPLVVDKFLSEEGPDNRLKMKNLPSLEDYQVVDTKWVSAGFVFTKGEWVKKIKIPEQMVFSGEEDAQTYLSYLKGWNIKLTSEATIWHNYNYKTVEEVPYRIHNNEHYLQDNALEEINNLLFNQVYERSVEDLENYLDIKFKKPSSYSSNNKIFVAIASYLDYELPYTIFDIIQKSSYPENLYFGICLQYNNDSKTNQSILDFLVEKFNIKIIKFPYEQSEGGCWARQKAQQFYNGEKYTLQVDSHTRFIQGWDSIVLRDYNHLLSKGIKKPLLSYLPPSYSRDDEKGIDLNYTHINQLDRLNIPKFKEMTSDYWLKYVGYDDEKNIGFTPHPIKIIYGGFVFTTGNWVNEVEQDPEHYYTGEELALAIRSYTHGYDLFTPSQIVAWHRSHPTPNKKHFNNNPQEIGDAKHFHAMTRLSKLINKENLGKYGLGKDRTLEDYEKYAMLNFKDKLVL